MRGGLHNATALAAVAGHQPALLRIETFILCNNPLVKPPFTEGLAAGFFGRRWLPERDNVSHVTPCLILVQTYSFEPGFHSLDK